MCHLDLGALAAGCACTCAVDLLPVGCWPRPGVIEDWWQALEVRVRVVRKPGETLFAVLDANDRLGDEVSAFVGPIGAERETLAGNLLHQTLAAWDCLGLLSSFHCGPGGCFAWTLDLEVSS